MTLHEFEHRLARRAKPALVGGPAHGLSNTVGGELWDHAGTLCRRQARAMSQDAGVRHQQFPDRAGLATEHDPAKMDLRVYG
jgi:hypothetical protein